MLVEFYKGPASGYDAGSHSNGIYQCTDTGDTYIFGVLNKGGKGIRVLDFDTDFKGGSGNMDGDLYNTLKQELSDGVPMFIKMMVEENPIIYPLIVSKSHALASPNPEVLDFQIAINSIMGDNIEKDGGGISVMANFLEVRGDTFEISLSAQSLLLLTEEKGYRRVLANNGQYVGTLLDIRSIPKQAYDVVKEVVADKNLTSGTWETFKTYVDTGIRSDAYWDYYFTGTSFGTFRYDYTESTATITTYSLVDESLENPAEQLSKQYATIYNISSEGLVTSTTTNVPKLQYDESGVIVGAGNGTEEKSITLLTGGDGSKVLADNGSYISSQDSRVYVWEILETEIDYDDIQYGFSFLSRYSTEGLKGTFNITEDIYNSINNSQVIVIKLTSSTDSSNYKYDIVQKSTDLRNSGPEEEPILTLNLVGFSNLISGSSFGYYRNELTILIPTVSNDDSTYSVSWDYTSSNVSRLNIDLSSLISIDKSSNILASSNGVSPEEYSKIEYSYISASSINLLSVSYYGGLSKVVSNIARNNYPEQDQTTYYLGILVYSYYSNPWSSDNYPKLVRVSISPNTTGGDGTYKDYHPVTIESIVDLKTLSIIETDGEGNQFLSDDGTYKTISIPDSVTSIKVGENADSLVPESGVVTLPAATTEADGIMSKTDKTSLDSLSGLGFVLLSEEETNELLKNDSSTAISEPLYTKLSDPNTHLVIFTNVSKEGGLDGGSSETERIYYMLEKRVIATGNTISLIYSNSYGTSGATGNISYSTYDIDTDKIVTRSNFHLTFELMGDGDKFLSDDGTYRVIEVPTEATQISLSNSYVPSDLENESLIPAAGDTVETVIGKLHKAILDNEEVVASAFTKLNSSCGFNNNGEYVPVGSITTGTNSLGGAISKLDSSISSIKSFRDIAVGESTLTPESSSDTLTLTQGEGITLTPGGDNKSLTISASGLVSRVTAVESELQGVNALADELLTLTE